MKAPFNILIIDDSDGERAVLRILLEEYNFSTDEAKSGNEAIKKMRDKEYHLIITDLRMEDGDGWQVLEVAGMLKSLPEVIVITGFGSIEDGVRAIKSGAYDFLEKPIVNQKLVNMVRQVASKKELEYENELLKAKLREQNAFDSIIGTSKAIQEVLILVSQVSHTDSTVLITGESGTGKEVIARAIHANSPRGNRNFVAINCGAIPETLQESELFGHLKGSFTGALRDKPGLFMEADNGTVFLDEVGELSLTAQVKLLRFLQDGEIRRVGDNKVFNVNARLIAATNKILSEEIKKNNFREDLYYRLSVIPVHLPPLRDRDEDVALLANYFLKKFAKKLKSKVNSISKRSMNFLNSYSWPGNVRELENVIERAVVLCNGNEIKPDVLPFHIVNKNFPDSLFFGAEITLAELEKRHIKLIYEKCNGDRKKIMDILQIPKTTLWRKLKEYEIIP